MGVESSVSFVQLVERMRGAGVPVPSELSILERCLKCEVLLPKEGGVFGDFRVDEAVEERGAYGLLYRVTRVTDGLPLILKVLRPELSSEAGVRAFLRESDILIACTRQRLQGVPLILARGKCGQPNAQLYYYLMEELSGQTLKGLVHEYDRDSEPFPVSRLLLLMMRLSGIVERLHQVGIVHRDIKPENVFLQAGAPVLIDFGSAAAPVTLTAHPNRNERTLHGTFSTMAPEQARHERPQVAMDVFSLGATLRIALFGNGPYVKAEESFWGMERDHKSEMLLRRAAAGEIQPLPARVDVSEALREVLEKAMAPDPARRYTSARAFARALRRLLRS